MHLLVMCKLQLEFGTSEKEKSMKQVTYSKCAGGLWMKNRVDFAVEKVRV